MKKYFINCGSHNGCSTRWFRDTIDKNEEYFIYSFEPDPRFKDCYKGLKKHKFINKVVWIKNGRVDFYPSMVGLANGGSVMENKRTGSLDKGHPLNVKCIDFGGWIKKHFKKEDYVFVKFDIEGAEYEVLEKMMEDKSFDYIDRLSVSFHYHKLRKMLPSEHTKFEKKLKEHLKIPLEYWRFVHYGKYTKKPIKKYEELRTEISRKKKDTKKLNS